MLQEKTRHALRVPIINGYVRDVAELTKTGCIKLVWLFISELPQFFVSLKRSYTKMQTINMYSLVIFVMLYRFHYETRNFLDYNYSKEVFHSGTSVHTCSWYYQIGTIYKLKCSRLERLRQKPSLTKRHIFKLAWCTQGLGPILTSAKRMYLQVHYSASSVY